MLFKYKEIKYDLEPQPVDPREKEKQEKLEKHVSVIKSMLLLLKPRNYLKL